MTKESTGEVLEGIAQDAELAEQVAAGDYTGLADKDLADAERALLEAAASELGDDDVSGFAGYLQIGDIKGDSHSILFPKVEIVHLSATRDVIDYLGYKL